MDVWISGHPEHKVTVAAKPSYNRLKVLPFDWKEDMPVKFSGTLSKVKTLHEKYFVPIKV